MLRRDRPVILVLGLVLALVLLGAYYLGRPRVLEFSPADLAGSVPRDEPIRVTFSRPLNPDTVQARFKLEPNLPGSIVWEDSTLVFQPDQPWPSGQTVQVRLEAGAEAAGLLPLALQDELAWSFTASHPRLLYLYPSDGPANLQLYDPVTAKTTPLTDVAAGIVDFHVSPDGSAVYYSVRSGDGSGLYRLPLETGNVTSEDEPELLEAVQILDCPQALCRGGQVSPDGLALAYERTAFLGVDQPTYPQVWVLPLEPLPAEAGPDVTPTALAGEPVLVGEADHQTLQPAWSPTGLLTFYDSSELAFVLLNRDSGEKVLFPNQTGQPGDWEAVGEAYLAPEISFLGPTPAPNLPELDSIASSHLIRFEWRTGKTTNLSGAENLEDTTPAYSPDGSYLAFARKFLDIAHWTPGRQLWVMRADGMQARALTEEPYYNHFNFSWSPDGEHLALVRFNQTVLTEPPEIWLINLSAELPSGPDDVQSDRLVVGGYAPQWTP